MKRFFSILTGLFLLVLSLNANAQTAQPADYFAGKWNLLIKGPNGDRKMVLVLEKNESKITGVVQDTTGKELSKVSNAQLKENEISLDCNINDHDVPIVLTRKDDDHATGTAMGNYDIQAERVKATKP